MKWRKGDSVLQKSGEKSGIEKYTIQYNTNTNTNNIIIIILQYQILDNLPTCIRYPIDLKKKNVQNFLLRECI